MRARAKYDFTFDTIRGHRVIYITDEGGPNDLTITNDIENVIFDVEDRTGINLNDYIILYRDSEGMWDAWKNDDFIILQQQNSIDAVNEYIDEGYINN